MLRGLVVAAVLLGIVGAYNLWNRNQNRSVIPTHLLATHMPVKLKDEFSVLNYDSSILPSIDGGLELTLWRISLGSDDRKAVADYCDNQPMWSPPVDAKVPDTVLNHSNHFGASFSPCELFVERRAEKHGYGTNITYDGKYLLLERVRAWP